ncbi:MAG: zinc-binding dehydrogenase, partial [Clostridia bacterium]|nr:zinc-binding dehydrogenase [Clostridia bacterium]
MKAKHILFTAPGVAEIVEKDVPALADDAVLVKVTRTSISAGTEKANLIGDRVTFRGNNKPFPRQCGYSAVGVVHAIGSGVTTVKVGDRVACSWTYHADYCVLPEFRVYPISDKIDDATGALAHIATFPLAAVRKCAPELGESAMVMGLGVLGMIAVEFLRISGAAPIIAVDPVPEKREKALKLGADYALDPFMEGFAARVKELTGGGVNV